MQVFKYMYIYIYICTQESSVGVASRLWAGRPRNRNSILSLLYNAQTTFGAHPDSYAMVLGLFPRGVKQQEREADHLPPSSAEVKKCTATLPLPNMSLWRGA
jgi:hypothetical protein